MLECDADGDGHLNKEEFREFADKCGVGSGGHMCAAPQTPDRPDEFASLYYTPLGVHSHRDWTLIGTNGLHARAPTRR